MRKMQRVLSPEKGSVYILALLTLLLVTTLGLTLVAITESERVIGANEVTTDTVFYGTDSGLRVAAAEALASGRYRDHELKFSEPPRGQVNSALQVKVSPFVPISVARCNWCPANDDGVPQFWRVTHAVTADTERVLWTGASTPPPDAPVRGRKTVGVMFDFQPWGNPPTDPLLDPEKLAKVKF